MRTEEVLNVMACVCACLVLLALAGLIVTACVSILRYDRRNR